MSTQMTGGKLATVAAGYAVSGAIGAAVANASNGHPVIKGALASGAIGAIISLVYWAGTQMPEQVGTSGPPRQLRFP
jgi:hypothetical protein